MFNLEIGRLIERSCGQVHEFRPLRVEISECRSALPAKEAAAMIGRVEFTNFIGAACPTKVIVGHQRPGSKRAPGGFATLRTVARHRYFRLDIELVAHVAAKTASDVWC